MGCVLCVFFCCVGEMIRCSIQWREWSYLALGGLGSCLGLRTGVSPHFSTSSKREMMANHERGAAPPPSGPMPYFWGNTLTRPRTHTYCARRCRGRWASIKLGNLRNNIANCYISPSPFVLHLSGVLSL